MLHPRLLAGVNVPPLAWSDVVLGTIYPVAGAAVVRSRPRNAVGWGLLIASLIGPYLLAATIAAWSALVRPDPMLGTDALLWFAAWGFVPYFFVLPFVLLLFPDGQPATPRWRPVVVGFVALAGVTTVVRMFSGIEPDMVPGVTNPLGFLGDPWKYVTLVGAIVCLFGATALGIASLRVRARRAVGAERAQLQWLSLGGIVLLLALLDPFTSRDVGGDIVFAIGLAAPPLAIAVAMVRHQLFDVEFALNRTIVFVAAQHGRGRRVPRHRRGGRQRGAVLDARRRRSSRWSRWWRRAAAASCRPVSTGGCSVTAATRTRSSPGSGATSRRRASRRRRCSGWSTRCETRFVSRTSLSTEP